MPRVLFLTSHLPFPPLSGGRRREYELLRRLADRHDIEVCAVTRTSDYDRAHVDAVTSFARVTLFDSPKADAEVAPAHRGASFLTKRNASAAAAAFVQSRIEDGIDLVHCEGFYMRALVGSARVPILLMEQNIEHLVWPEAADSVRTDELRSWRTSTCCAAVTEDDAALIRRVVDPRRVFVSFDGCDHDAQLETTGKNAPEEFPQAPVVFCPGNYAYRPSYEAGRLMCEEIGPAILREVPEATILLVGNEATRLSSLPSDSRIWIRGRVPSLEPYYASATIMVCPLFLGRGVKVKILEALVRGCAVVTTEIGVQGLPQAPVVVADGTDDVATAAVDLLRDAARQQRLRKRAADYARSLPTWDQAATQLHDCWMRTMQGAAMYAAPTVSELEAHTPKPERIV